MAKILDTLETVYNSALSNLKNQADTYNDTLTGLFQQSNGTVQQIKALDANDANYEADKAALTSMLNQYNSQIDAERDNLKKIHDFEAKWHQFINSVIESLNNTIMQILRNMRNQ